LVHSMPHFEKLKMKSPIDTSIERTYEAIEKCLPHTTLIDSLEVVRQVEQYRQFWKPEEIKVALLAESHVHTAQQDYETKCNKSILSQIIPNYPLHFVRFVYCLGYGENELLDASINSNKGTWQYWKIFSSCVAENEHDLGFPRILKKGIPSLFQRLRNKVNVLQKMKESGIWLLDASIVGLYRSGVKSSSLKNRIIKICWQNHLVNIISNSKPQRIIIIGKRVEQILRSRLVELGFSPSQITTIPQPQARLSSEERLENFRRYQRICSMSTIISEKREKPKLGTIAGSDEVSFPPKKRPTEKMVKWKPTKLGYRKTGRNTWVKGDRIVHVVRSSEFGRHIRITHMER